MAGQYDVCLVTGLTIDSAVDLAVVLQDDKLATLTTRVVAPLVPVDERYRIDRTTPMVELQGIRYAVAVHLLSTLPRRNLGPTIATLREHERTLKNAIDAVFFGV